MATDLPPLRFITCGSVDDGKSTLIGRLLHETKCVFEDQLTALESDSRQYGTQGERIDFALLTDGLQAEREQGITIDVAYRFFASPKRRFIVADTPGHEQYTRNMATGASTAELAVILVDVRKGVLTQTMRHARIVAMMGIKHVVLAVNKIDLVDFSEPEFNAVVDRFSSFSASLGFSTVTAIPVSGLEGDNVASASSRMPWYGGMCLIDVLDSIDTRIPAAGQPLSMPVQWVNRPDSDFRGFCGRIAQGSVRSGDRVRVLPSGLETTIKEIVVWQGNVASAEQGDSITVTLTDEVDVCRGDVIAAADEPPQVADQFEARLLWMAEQPLVSGRPYLLKLHNVEVTATVSQIKYREDVNSGARLAARSLAFNEIGTVNVSLGRPVVFAPYTSNRILGGFILIDKLSHDTVGAGMIDFALRRADNIHWQSIEVNRAARAEIKGQKPCCVWFTGLSGSGKSTIANQLDKQLHSAGYHTYVLDGDNVRHGLNRDLGFTEADRVENIRRIAEVSRLMVDAGLIVLVSFISPFKSERAMARELFAPDEFMEVFVSTPLAECERRDPKGLYKKARRGEIPNFTGIDSIYEAPENPEIILNTESSQIHECAAKIFKQLNKKC